MPFLPMFWVFFFFLFFFFFFHVFFACQPSRSEFFHYLFVRRYLFLFSGRYLCVCFGLTGFFSRSGLATFLFLRVGCPLKISRTLPLNSSHFYSFPSHSSSERLIDCSMVTPKFFVGFLVPDAAAPSDFFFLEFLSDAEF